MIADYDTRYQMHPPSSHLYFDLHLPAPGRTVFISLLQPILYSEMSIGVPKEVMPREKRVAQTPDTVGKLTKLGITVNVEAGAGEPSKCSDDRYVAAGAKIVNRDAVRF